MKTLSLNERYRLTMRLQALLLCCTALPLAVGAQSIPAPSRTVFKCVVNNTVTYSDSPCPGAEKLDIEPTRGLNKRTGKELVGPDVARERRKEALAEAVRPITGMDARQFQVAQRRTKLSAERQRECRELDKAIPIAEAAEKSPAKAQAADAQTKLFVLRRRYREIQC